MCIELNLKNDRVDVCIYTTVMGLGLLERVRVCEYVCAV